MIIIALISIRILNLLIFSIQIYKIYMVHLGHGLEFLLLFINLFELEFHKSAILFILPITNKLLKFYLLSLRKLFLLELDEDENDLDFL